MRVRLVGEISVEVDGERRGLPPGRPLSLFAWLALNAGSHPRASLAPRFWPDVLDASSRASLRSALWALRRAVGEDGLVATRDRVGLASGTWVDVLEADRLAAEGRHEEALALCHGELISEIEDEWAHEARDHHRDRTVDLLEELSAQAERAGDLQRAVELTRRQAVLEPLSEKIHRALMRRLDAAGDRASALAEYAELRSRLLARLRIGPSAETDSLADALRRGTQTQPAVAAFPSRLLRADRAAFVGREHELSRITSAWRKIQSGDGPAQVVLLAGEAGIGKSRLAARFAAEASRDGATVLYGACEEQSLLPFEPFVEALGGEPADRREIEVRLSSASAGAPLVLVLDDLHLADRNTLALLARVARGAAGERLLALGTYRDADAVGTPLLTAIADLRRDCDVERIGMEGLSVDEVATLLEDSADARRVHDRTDGNPFFVRELVRHLADRSEGAGDVPESVNDVVLARVGRLSRRSAETLAAASVLGVSFQLPELEALESDGLLDSLDEACAAGLVEEASGGRYRFAHALTRDVVYGSIGPSRRSELHRRAAEAIERVHGLDPGPELAAIAMHLFDGARQEDVARGVELAERAASWALDRNAYEQAVTLLTRALALMADPDVERRRRLTRARAVAYARLTHALFDVDA